MNDYPDPNDDFDPELEALFRREHTHLPVEPFTGAAQKRIAVARTRAAMIKRVLQGAALIGLILVSPWLIEASVIVSASLDELFAIVSAWLATPLGMAVALAVGAALAAAYRLLARR